MISTAAPTSPSNLGSFRRRSTCRACEGGRLELVLSLGPTALANAFLDSPSEFDSEAVYPLDVYYCESCSLLQLTDVVDSQVLFDQYIYVSGTSDTVAKHNRALALRTVQSRQLGSADLVVEIASNDGSLLKCFRSHGVQTLGVEPAGNVAALARRDGVDTMTRFFSSELSREIREERGPASVVICNNVLAHVDDVRDFLDGCRTLLSDDGLLIVEVPYVRDLLEGIEYDTIYHEHLCYFSVTTLAQLISASGLSVQRVERIPIHGGSLRVYSRRATSPETRSDEVEAIIDGERRDGLARIDTYEGFAKSVAESREATVELLSELGRLGARVAGYGAPAKGNTLLSYCGITPALLPYTVDKNPWKVGKYTPGTHIPVLSASVIDERRPDYLFLLAWNFADEIMRQQADFVRRGGKFIVPVPQPRVLTA